MWLTVLGGDILLKRVHTLLSVRYSAPKYILFMISLYSGTVRRFLEHYSDQVELIVFVVQTDYVGCYCDVI